MRFSSFWCHKTPVDRNPNSNNNNNNTCLSHINVAGGGIKEVLIVSFFSPPHQHPHSDGSLSTKQILFLQRPVLQRKRKDFKVAPPPFTLSHCTPVTRLPALQRDM